MRIRDWRIVFLFLLLCGLAEFSFATTSGTYSCETPNFPHVDTADEREFQEVYQCISSPNAHNATISTATITNLNISSGTFQYAGIALTRIFQRKNLCTTTNTSNSSNAFADTALSITLTPQAFFLGSRMRINASGSIQLTASGGIFAEATIARGGSNLLGTDGQCVSGESSSIGNNHIPCSLQFDELTPSASSLTYSVQIRNTDNVTQVNWPSSSKTITNPTPQQEALFTGMDVIGGSAEAAIAEYANYVVSEQQRQASDPLVAYQTLEQNFAKDKIAEAENLYGQLQDLQSSAPKLFGEFTSDQIDKYLAPLQRAFTTSVSQVQGILASRGLVASSTEANALAESDRQFKENVLSTGLNIGIQSKQQKSQSIQQQIQNLLQVGSQAQGEAGKATSQISSQNLGQSNLIASLPYFLRSTGTQEANADIAAANAKTGGFLKTFNDITGAINTGVNTFETLAMIPQQFKSSPQSTGSAPSTPGATMTGGSSSPLNLPQYQSLFQTTGSAFGS